MPKKAASKGNAWFGLVFAGVGLLVLSLMTLLPAYGWLRSRAWVETPARVTSAALQISRGQKGGDSYRVAVTYDYDFAGRRHTGNRYDFSGGSTGIGEARMRRAVEDLRENPSVTCLVNPENPAEAVLTRRIPVMAFVGVPVALVFTGAGVLIWRSGGGARREALALRRREELARRLREQGRLPGLAAESGSLIVSSVERRRRKAREALVFCAVWAGFFATFAFLLFDEWGSSGAPSGMLFLAVLVFGAVGYYLFRFTVRQLRNLRRRDWVLELSRVPPAAGGPVELAFCVPRPRPEDALKTWSIRLIGVACSISPRTRRPSTPRTGLFTAKDVSSAGAETELARGEALIYGDAGRVVLETPAAVFPADKPAAFWALRWVAEVDDQSGLVERAELTE